MNIFYYDMYGDSDIMHTILVTRLGILLVMALRESIRKHSQQTSFIMDVTANISYLIFSFYIFVSYYILT